MEDYGGEFIMNRKLLLARAVITKCKLKILYFIRCKKGILVNEKFYYLKTQYGATE